MVSSGTSRGASLKHQESPPKATLRYKHYNGDADPTQQAKKPPSQHLAELSRPAKSVEGWRPRPEIKDLSNVSDFSTHVKCAVKLGEPIFQPFPPEVTFHNYEPFQTYEATLYLRNNDNVPRMVKVAAMDSPYFSVRKAGSAAAAGAADGQPDSKVATGMEVAFIVTFRPESKDDYNCNLVVLTEREKFHVPVLAIGAAAALDFPDHVDFGSVPAKVETKQTVFVRNAGSKAAHFSLSVPPPFTVLPTAGHLSPGETLQCTVGFEPPSTGRYDGELEIRYDSGRCAYSQVCGQGHELEVGLSQGVVNMLSTFVTKTSQKTFKLVNNSETAVRFAVKQRPTAEQDEALTAQRLNTLTTHNAAAAPSSYGNGRGYGGGGGGSDGSEGGNSSEDEDTILANPSAALTRRLDKAQRDALLDGHLFQDRNFAVTPSEGTIWPRGEVEVVVSFSPDHAREYEVVAYVDLAGRAERLPVVFKGRGLGPAAVFSYDVLDVGDTWVNTLHQYEVELQNRGKIDVDYRLVPPGTAFGSKFSFEPPSGRLSGGQIEVIKVKLLSDLLGNFNEVFSWQIKGSSQPLSLQFKGRVCAPSFEVDVDELDFSVVSYGFRYTKEFTLTNTSEIPLRFSWRVPTDTEEPREFQILPAKGTILPHGRLKVNVEFVSRTVQRYNSQLVMDIPGVAERQLELPLKGECAVPLLSLHSDRMEFGECSLRFPYKQEMRIRNQSKLPAKFEVVPQETNSLGLASFTVEPSSGGIPACGEQVVEVTLQTFTLGRIQIPVRVKALGSKSAPLEFIINARCIGPQLDFGDDPENRTTTPTIAFDRVPVLKEHSLPLTINNISPIPADFKLFIEAKDSVFSVEPREAFLQPGESCVAHVIVKMDESMDFTDTLHVLIQEGADMAIPLTASGTGSAIVAEELSAPMLDFGYQFVGRPHTKDIVVYNMGRKSVLLAWSSCRFEDLKKEYAKANRGQGKKFDITLVPPEQHPVFNVQPDKVQLGPKEAATFTFTCLSLQPGEVREQLVCMGTFGNNTKAARRMFEPFLRAEVATPLLHFSERLMHFRHTYRKGVSPEASTRPLTIRNISPLPLSFNLKIGAPFALDRTAWSLDLEESGTVNVTFDPNYKDDLQSAQVRTKLQVAYTDNPQRDSVDMHADIDFPNLVFETTNIDFGSVLLDTTRRVPVRVTNTSNVDVVYTWAWDKTSVQEDVNSIASMNLRQGGRPKPPPTQLFDVMPIRGVLRPGEAEVMTFSFFAYPGVKGSCTAICQVEGGPVYTVQLAGESNNIKYNVEPQSMDFGVQLYDRAVERELTVTNSGKVPFAFNFNYSRLSRPGIVEATPASGTIAPLAKEVIKLKVCPGIPERLVETLLVEVAHFDPVPVTITVDGTYAAVSLNLPRIRDDAFQACVETARSNIITAALSHVPTEEPNKPGGDAISVGASVAASRRGAAAASPDLPPPRSAGARSTGGPSPTRGTRSIAAPMALTMQRAQSAHSVAGHAGVQLSVEKKVEVEAERLRLIQMLLERESERRRVAERTAALNAALEAGAAAAGQPGPAATLQRQLAGDISPAASAAGAETRRSAGAQSRAAPSMAAPSVTAQPGLARRPSQTTIISAMTGVRGAGDEENRRASRAVVGLQPALPALSVAHYVLDFGYVVKGLTRVRKFRITNTSNQQVTFRFDKNLLENNGFKIDPEVVSRLPGAPEFGSVDITVTLQANKSSVNPGPIELVYPISVKGAPPVLLTLRAHVQVPDLKLSQEVLDFGSCQTGQCKVVTVQLHNHKQVPCEYAIKRPAEVIKAKDWQFFTCEPAEGTLEPDQRVNLQVMFTPILNREAPYSQGIPIKINLNPKMKELTVSGRGLTPRVTFSPNFVDCGPILPFLEGQEPNEARVTMVNPCAFPIEVVSLDFDTRYGADEDALRAMDGYNENGILYLPPLKPGDALWSNVAEAAAQKKRMEAAAAEAQAAQDGAAAAAAAAGASPANSPPPPGGYRVSITGMGAPEEGVGSLEAVAGGVAANRARAELEGPQKVFVVVTGPSLVGKTTQAKLLGQRYGVPVVALDELLLEAADLEPPPADAEVPAEGEAFPLPEAAADEEVEVEGGEGRRVSHMSGVLPAPPRPSFDGEISDLLFDKLLTDPDHEGKPEYVPPHTKLSKDELYGLVVRGVRHAVAQMPEYGKGMVLDGLVSRYLPPPLVAKALLEGLGLERVMPPPPPPPPEPEVKAKKGKKGEEPPPPPTPPPPEPLGWRGPYRVHVLDLTPSDDVLLAKRLHHKDTAAPAVSLAQEPAVQAPEATLAPPGSRLTTPLVSGEVVLAPVEAGEQQQQQPGGADAGAAAAAVTDVGEKGTLTAEGTVASMADAEQQRYLEDAARALAEYLSHVAAPVEELLAGPDTPENVVRYRKVAAEGGEAKVHKAACGISFRLGVLSTLLPPAPCDSELVPPRYAMQIVPKPRPRAPRNPVQRFKIFTFIDYTKEGAPPPPPPPPPPVPATPPTPSKGAGRPKKGEEPPPPPPPPPPTRALIPDTRWVIPAGGSVELLVQFSSPDVGKFTETLAFDVLGGERLNTLVVTGTCDYPHISTDYRNVFYKKVKARPQTPLIRGQYVISKGVFEFGPLLHSKDPTGYLEGGHPDNTARIRITNNGLFDNQVTFSLKSKEQAAAEEEAAGAKGKGGKDAKKPKTPEKPKTPPVKGAKDGKGGKGAPAPGTVLDGVFVLHPTSLNLKVDETQELAVYAFPTEDGPVEDVIICRIKDNPVPVEFPISVIGAKPQVLVYLNDGTPPPDPTRPPPPPPEPASRTASKPGTPLAPTQPVNKLLAEGVQFERLLVNKKDVKTFTISNPGLLPITWRLANTATLPKEFVVFPQSGELAARSDVVVTVEFSAIEKRLCEARLALEVLDVAELQGVAHSIPLPIKGEAYKIEIDVNFPQANFPGVDFGTLRVVDSVSKPITIKNTGKYAISYNLAMKPGSVLQSLLTITPSSGSIEPNKDAKIELAWNKDKSLRNEVMLMGNSDVTLSIIEPLTTNKEDTIPVQISGRAVFSKYAVTPARGIHFGPVTYNTASKPKIIEITNLGQFDFNFKLFNHANGPPPPVAALAPGAKAPAAPKPAKPGSTAALSIGQFAFDPAEGTIPPGGRREVSVVFNAVGASNFSEVLGIDIAERDFTDQPQGIPIEVAGESCIPGIDAENTAAIFEEHTISASLDPFNPINNEFSTRERVFNFGAVLAQLGAAEAAASARAGTPEKGTPAAGSARSSARASTPSKGKGRKDEQEAVPSPALAPHAVRANLKFINPVKVPCVVNFTLKPRGNLPPGMSLPMEVSPAQLVIPPLEYRYTAVYFAPRAIQLYGATLEAVVENGSDPKTKSFTCELRGEGTLPTLTIAEPTQVDNQGRPTLKFGRLLQGRSSTGRITLKNNGILPAKARIEMPPHAAFSLEGGPVTGTSGSGSEAFVVDSKKSVSYTVVFAPQAVGPAQHELRLRVANNPFEDYRFLLSGEGYQEDVTFDHLPNDAMEELRLQDGPVGRPVQAVFALRNHSTTKSFRFRWPAPGAPGSNPHLSFSPAVGHLLAGSSKDVTLTFTADKPVKLQPQDVKLALVQIVHAADAQPVDWDDRSVVVDYGLPPGTDGQPAARPEPEPKVTDTAGSTRELLLRVYATADNAKYACEEGPIIFKPTMMFQTRSYTFPLTNKSSARMDFKFTVTLADGVTADGSELYTVSPAGGAIEAGASLPITVKFSPTEVDDCSRVLTCHIPHLDASCEPLARPLSGRVLRPWAHFELPDSDYLSAARRSPDMPGPSGIIEPLDPATRVLEVESLGVKVRNTKRFFVLNPTGISYEFFWQPANQAQEAGPFTCTTRRGVIGGGRRFEMVFEYTPTTDSVVESFWTFSIPEQNIQVPFLLVGLVSEPRVMLDRPSVNFGQILIGCKGHATLTLLNSEHLPFQFSFDKNTYDATEDLMRVTGLRPVVEFEPSSGSVPPHGAVTIAATFTPRLERDINYNVIVNVKNKPSRLTLNVKGEGTAIHEALQLENADGTTVTLAPRQANTLDFGQVLVNERCVRALALVNSGQTNFNFVWDVGTNPRVSISPEGGTVPRGERLVCELAYNPHGPDKLRDYKVTCQVLNGPKYTLLLNGVGHKPRLDLSWFNHDFGLQPVWRQGMTPAVKLLRLRNDDALAISVDPHWDAGALGAGDWQVDCSPVVLQPGESKDWVVTFRPRAATPCSLSLPLEINGLYTLHVEAKGEGSPLRVEVANPAHRAVNFGPVGNGGSSTRVVPIINRGRTTATLSLAPSAELLARCAIDVIPAPTSDIMLRPRESADLTFFFRPTDRMRPFTEELVVSLCGVPTPLATLTGACLGTELRLASDSLPFGPVVLGSRAVKRLQLENTGDVGTKFAWDTRALGPHFSIFPADGFLAPGQDVKLDVTFHPTEVNPDVRVDKVRLKVEGGEDGALTLTGACINTAAQPEAVAFACNVRASATQSVTISNTSSTPWSLRPVVQNEFFSGPESLSVPANSKATYTLTFRPLTMSTKEQPHEGSVFFPIPDGSGLLYRLVGRAEAPVPEGKIERAITAKAPHTEVLKCHNWLHKPQRFHILVERKAGDRSTQLVAPEYVDVPALSAKEVKLTVTSYTASTTNAVVTFKNDASGEYLFYELKFMAASPERRGTLQLECPVRTLVSTRVSVANPLPDDVTAKASATHKQVQVPPTIVLKGGTTTDIEVKYRPLVVGASEAALKVECAELGVFEWGMKLGGTPTNPERSMAFNVPLGSRETQLFRFAHWLDEKADYKVAFKSTGTNAGGAFSAAASISAPPAAAGLAAGAEVALEVTFEPTAIGENIRDTLVVSSATGGEYLCPLVGRCIAPKPQGPVDVSKGSAALPFTNVFGADAEFLLAVDNPAFIVKAAEKIGSKKSANIGIQFKPADASKPRTGKLTISCPSQTSSQWVYYLQA